MHRIKFILAGFAVLASTSVRAEQLKFSVAPGFFEAEPGGKPLGPCHGGAVIDKAGNIYVTTDTDRGIVVFSPEGKFMRAGGPTRIHGLEIREEDGAEYIYGARPQEHEVIKLKLTGEVVWSIGFPRDAAFYAQKERKAFQPCAVTVAPDGSIFIADGYGSNFILKYDRQRKFVKMFGGEGTEDGKFVKVIQKDLRMPAAVHIRGDFAVFPELQGRVTVLDKEGRIAAQVGDNPNEKQRANFPLPMDQWTEGICNSPHGASLDKDGNLIVSEWSKFGRVEKFVLSK